MGPRFVESIRLTRRPHLLAFSDAPGLNILGRFVLYLLLAFFWGDEVVVEGRYMGAHAARTARHAKPPGGDLIADIGLRSTAIKSPNEG